MNRIYKVIWNRVRGGYVVVGEHQVAKGKSAGGEDGAGGHIVRCIGFGEYGTGGCAGFFHPDYRKRGGLRRYQVGDKRKLYLYIRGGRLPDDLR